MFFRAPNIQSYNVRKHLNEDLEAKSRNQPLHIDVNMGGTVECTFELSKVKNDFEVTKFKLSFRVIAQKVLSVSWFPESCKQIKVLSQRTVYLNLPILCTGQCIETLAPVAAGLPKMLGDFSSPNKYKD